MYLWALSRPRDSLPSVTDDQDADTARKQGPGKTSDGKPLDKVASKKAPKEASDFISAARGSPELMHGTADREHGSKADDAGSGKLWKAACAKSLRPDLQGGAHLGGAIGSGRGLKRDSSVRGARPAGHVGSRASEDSSAPP